MCCIFTCCGWVVDLIQRVWVFLMSCVIGSAVCCVLITSSMSGVALGYNYSLAEYIETKETNVSVYLKRGVFDDEVSQDMEWRRRGHKSLNPLLKDDGDLKTAAPDSGPDEIPFRRSNRRLEDSIIDSDAKNNFEGSLMKLTVKPPYSKTTRTFHTNDEEMLKVHSSYTPGSLDEIKGIQSLINKRKMNAGRDSTVKATNNYGDNDLAHYPGPIRRIGDRRMMRPGIGDPTPAEPMIANMRNENELPRINPARYAVPDAAIGSPGNWFMPKMDPEKYRKMFDVQDESPPPYPSPVTIRPSKIRPPTATSIMPHLIYHSSAATRTMAPGLITDDMDVEKFRQRNEDFLKRRPGMKLGAGSDADYYDDDVKGIPVRKRRSVHHERIETELSSKISNHNTLSEKETTYKEATKMSIILKPQEYVSYKVTPKLKNFIVTKLSRPFNQNKLNKRTSTDKYKQTATSQLQDVVSKITPKVYNFLVTKVSVILNHDKLRKINQTDKHEQISTLPQAKVSSEENLQELNHEQTKFKVGKSISDAIKYYLSISLSKLNLFYNVQSTNEKENNTTAGNKTYLLL